jgi:predicted phosphodiesterase
LGEERVERDRAVGRAETPELRVLVRQGHAAVRELDAGRVHLWANAPSLEVELTLGPEEPGDPSEVGGAPALGRVVELFVENCMPRAELAVLSGKSDIEVLPKSLPTECRYHLVDPSRALVVRLADPEASVPGPFHFGVLSDIQEAIDRVEDIYRRINQETQLSFVLGAGDLTERGSEPELRRFQQELKVLRLPYYTTLGNHELGESPPPYHAYFGRGNSSFVFRGTRFTLLDSASATLDPEVYDWLAEWLRLGKDQLHVVAMHIPPLDPTGVRNGAFASRNEATKLLSQLARGGVDLTIYGHVHSYYHFQNAGIPAHISGGGGAIPERFDALGRHFLDVAVGDDEILGARVIRVD